MTVLPEKPSSVSPAAVTSLSLGRCALPVANVWLTEEVWSLPRESECGLSNPDSSSVLEACSTAPRRGQSRGLAQPGYAHQVCPW